jgi:hypothetical protein
MIASGKMPYPWLFEASEGMEEIMALMEAVQNRGDRDEPEVIEDIVSRGG